jgi:hypothetical protein
MASTMTSQDTDTHNSDITRHWHPLWQDGGFSSIFIDSLEQLNLYWLSGAAHLYWLSGAAHLYWLSGAAYLYWLSGAAYLYWLSGAAYLYWLSGAAYLYWLSGAALTGRREERKEVETKGGKDVDVRTHPGGRCPGFPLTEKLKELVNFGNPELQQLRIIVSDVTWVSPQESMNLLMLRVGDRL